MSHPTWVRGLKLTTRARGWHPSPVAPYVGAWIETCSSRSTMARICWSHPTWVRGLKLCRPSRNSNLVPSHPTWVRGLKLVAYVNVNHEEAVAPYVGAWIETEFAEFARLTMGVAPYVGAWIETPKTKQKKYKIMSHPTWVRGLKLC